MIDPSLTFQRSIIIEGKKQALGEATKNQTGLDLWTDRSNVNPDKLRVACCLEDKKFGEWQDKSVFLGKDNEVLDAEL